MTGNEHRTAVYHAIRLLVVPNLLGSPPGAQQRAALDMLADLLADDFALADIDAGVKAHIKSSRYWPKPSELVEQCRRSRHARAAARVAAALDARPAERTGDYAEAFHGWYWPRRYRLRAHYETAQPVYDDLCREAGAVGLRSSTERLGFIARHPSWRALIDHLGYEPFPELAAHREDEAGAARLLAFTTKEDTGRDQRTETTVEAGE